MPKTSATARIQDVTRIHRVILLGNYPNDVSLAKQLELSRKTVRAYRRMLSDVYGVHPIYDNKRHGYYYESNGKTDLVPKLSDDEAVALILLEMAGKQFKGTAMQSVIESVLAKLSLMAPSGMRVTLDEVSRSLSYAPRRGEAIQDAGKLAELFRAARTRQRIRIAYNSRGRHRPVVRKVDPYHLCYAENQFYLVGFCHLRQDVRVFVPMRIKNLQVLAEAFVPPARFDPEQRFREAFGVVGGNPRSVALKFDAHAAQLVRERMFHKASQELEELSGGEVRLRMTCTIGEELVGWLLGWGEHVTVESPGALAQAVEDGHRKALEKSTKRSVRREARTAVVG